MHCAGHWQVRVKVLGYHGGISPRPAAEPHVTQILLVSAAVSMSGICAAAGGDYSVCARLVAKRTLVMLALLHKRQWCRHTAACFYVCIIFDHQSG